MHVQTDVPKIAELARITLTSDEAATFSEQLPRILDYVSQLQAVTVEQVAATPMSPIAVRADAVSSSHVVEAILAEAPERQDRFWKVKAVFS